MVVERLFKNPVVKYFLEAKEELNKVAWPSRDQVILYSGIVGVICIVTALYLGGIDLLFTKGLDWLIQFTGAELTGTELTGTDLTGSEVITPDLTGVEVTPVQVQLDAVTPTE